MTAVARSSWARKPQCCPPPPPSPRFIPPSQYLHPYPSLLPPSLPPPPSPLPLPPFPHLVAVQLVVLQLPGQQRVLLC